jgi:hypothetical protein
MLTWCGVSCGGKYIVIESSSFGLVSGGVLERMGGEGTLVKVHLKKEFKKYVGVQIKHQICLKVSNFNVTLLS